ncbi:hypothetical protein K466DRAFT_580201 [Polyporus arcularius HHB13444]|uniref:Uncharacterized protein n=1 Tax=Polyporus arcularius HHB13444 TaxID=1314778 RepID=A0A5C3Q746_9APHY|nr:hypothetical protein K466DRAFT_580201 [Polyporus arcularius HHB13444]
MCPLRCVRRSRCTALTCVDPGSSPSGNVGSLCGARGDCRRLDVGSLPDAPRKYVQFLSASGLPGFVALTVLQRRDICICRCLGPRSSRL